MQIVRWHLQRRQLSCCISSVKNLKRALVPLLFFLLMQLASGTSPLVPPGGTERGVAPHLRPKLAVIAHEPQLLAAIKNTY